MSVKQPILVVFYVTGSPNSSIMVFINSQPPSDRLQVWLLTDTTSNRVGIATGAP